jgi:hypothetical protein
MAPFPATPRVGCGAVRRGRGRGSRYAGRLARRPADGVAAGLRQRRAGLRGGQSSPETRAVGADLPHTQMTANPRCLARIHNLTGVRRHHAGQGPAGPCRPGPISRDCQWHRGAFEQGKLTDWMADVHRVTKSLKRDAPSGRHADDRTRTIPCQEVSARFGRIDRRSRGAASPLGVVRYVRHQRPVNGSRSHDAPQGGIRRHIVASRPRHTVPIAGPAPSVRPTGLAADPSGGGPDDRDLRDRNHRRHHHVTSGWGAEWSGDGSRRRDGACHLRQSPA